MTSRGTGRVIMGPSMSGMYATVLTMAALLTRRRPVLGDALRDPPWPAARHGLLFLRDRRLDRLRVFSTSVLARALAVLLVPLGDQLEVAAPLDALDADLLAGLRVRGQVIGGRVVRRLGRVVRVGADRRSVPADRGRRASCRSSSPGICLSGPAPGRLRRRPDCGRTAACSRRICTSTPADRAQCKTGATARGRSGNRCRASASSCRQPCVSPDSGRRNPNHRHIRYRRHNRLLLKRTRRRQNHEGQNHERPSFLHVLVPLQRPAPLLVQLFERLAGQLLPDLRPVLALPHYGVELAHEIARSYFSVTKPRNAAVTR